MLRIYFLANRSVLIQGSVGWLPVAALAACQWLVFTTAISAQDSSTSAIKWSRSGEDWPKFLGPGIDGKSSERGILKDWKDGKLKVKWKLPTGEGYAMGSVADGRFFHFGRYGEKLTLICVAAETGKELWRYDYLADYQDLYGYDTGPRASPVIDGDRVYIYGVAGWLHCLEVETGKVLWKVNTVKQFGVVQNFFGVGSTPVVHESLLLVMVGGSPEADQQLPPGALDKVSPNGCGIVAFDKQTGKVVYQAVDDLASYSSLKLAKINGKLTLLAWMRESLVGLNPVDGQQRFSFAYRARMLESVNAATPVVQGDFVFLSECYQLGSVLLDLTGGKPKVVWDDRGRRGVMETHWNTGVIDGDYLFASSGRHAGSAELRCINWKTGKLQWRKRGLGRASCTLVDGHLVVVGEYGQLLLVAANGEKYELVTEYEAAAGESGVSFKPPCWAGAIVSHGMLWVRGRDQVVCFELKPE